MSRLRPAFFYSGRFFDGSTECFAGARDMYQALVGHIISRKLRYIFIYVLIAATLGFLFYRMPTAYLPNEDQGVTYIQVTLPSGSTLEQTDEVMNQIRNHFLVDEKEVVKSCFTIAGRGFSGSGQNVGLGFVHLKDWDLRQSADMKVDAVVKRAMAKFSKIRNARVFAFPPPAVMELGRAGGFDFQLQDRSGLGHETLMAARNQLLGMAAQDSRIIRVRPAGLEDCTAIPSRCGLGKGGRTRAFHRLHPHDYIRSVRRRLCKRFHPGGTSQAGLRPGRRPVSHASK